MRHGPDKRTILALTPARLCRWGVLLLALGWTATSGWTAPALIAQLDRNVVPVGETVTLSLVFQDAGPVSAPALPGLPNLNLAPNVGQSTQVTIVNGQRSENHTFTYTLVAAAPGDVVIPSITAQAGGRTFTSTPLQLKIVAANSAAANPTAQLTNLAFIRLVVPKTEVFLGEPFPVEMHLYWQNAQDIRMPQLQAEGFSVGQMPKPTQTRTQMGGAIYNIAVFKLTATAARIGALALGPVEGALTVLVPVNNQRRSRDPFESFFGGPQYRQIPTTLTSEVVPMRVLALPKQNVPEGFNGAIGSYQLSVNAGPTNVGVGDPITVRVKISGRGPIDSLTLPAQSQWRDFNTYPPTSKVETSDQLGLVGSKSFEQVIIPQNHEIKALPP